MTDGAPQETLSTEALVERLIRLIDVEELDTDLYRGARKPGGVGRVFGGQVIGQALQAAQRSCADGKIAHSLHAYFMRPGDEDHPIIYRVVRDFDGGTFANRRVIAMQKGRPILNMAASFQTPEEGFHHQDSMPDIPGPEELPESDYVPERLRVFLDRIRPVEVRVLNADTWANELKGEPVQHCWLRIAGRLPDDFGIHRAILGYVSDLMLLGTSMIPHGVGKMAEQLQTASLDHAVWLHEPFRIDEWLLYTTDSPWAGHARGFNRGQIFARDGRLIASVAQEGLIRVRKPKG